MIFKYIDSRKSFRKFIYITRIYLRNIYLSAELDDRFTKNGKINLKISFIKRDLIIMFDK